MTIETRFDIPLIASLALKEKQIQQNYRPIIAVHKWFARRPGTLFRGLALAEFADKPVSEAFFEANDFPGRVIADPFMGGGTPLIEANRIGCDVHGFDINPMAAWIVKEEIEHIDLKAYRAKAASLVDALRSSIDEYYRTDCPRYGDANVPVKYFLWVKTLECESCKRHVDLFPHYLVADDTRHPKNVLVCHSCGELNEVASIEAPGPCTHCSSALLDQGPASRRQCECRHCGHVNKYPRPKAGPPSHRLFAIEYCNPERKSVHRGRFFKKPDEKDLERASASAAKWRRMKARFVPSQEILPGDETDRLHKWGYQRYCDLFNERQLLGLEMSCRLIAAEKNERIRRALATNLSDLLRYQNLLCRYDTMALKSLDIFSIHGFPVGLVQCESNLLGIINGGGTNVGSGGWTNVIEKYAKAKQYCDTPFETKQVGSRKTTIPIVGEYIGERMEGRRSRRIDIHCQSSTDAHLPAESLDAVFTDPPYFGNVQYGELMDFCYVWLRALVGVSAEGFEHASSRNVGELTGNATNNRGIEHFTDGLAAVYSKMARALKPGAPLAFTFHHNKIEAYHAVGVAILDAGLTCSAALPCPAEMGGSIHIHGTGSSIVDTVFVCRKSGEVPREMLFRNIDNLVPIVSNELSQLRQAGMKPTAGDIRCIVFGHVTRMAIWNLRANWRKELPATDRLSVFAKGIAEFGDLSVAIRSLTGETARLSSEAGPLFSFCKDVVVADAISF